MMPKETTIAAAETVKNTVSAASILSHLRNNRVEYLAVAILAHLLGVSDRILAQASGVCF
jgi:hypothetical protein